MPFCHRVGFFQNDWHVLVSKETLKRTDKYDIECWRPYQGLDEIYSKDVNGIKLGSEMQLTPNFNLEFAHDNKNKSTNDDEWYTKLRFVHPPVDGPTALDGRSDSAWKESRDMSGELLSKVNRQNKIMIEFKGTGTISRTD